MKRIQSAIVVLGLGAMTFARADLAPERKSTLTVIDRVEVPGTVLEAGTYVVKLGDVKNNRNIVIITNADETKVIATAIATPHEALQSTPNTAFTFYDSPPGTPRVLRTWFAPNEKIGQDLVYPAPRAAELAKVTKEYVPELTAEMSSDLDRNRQPMQPTEAFSSPAAEAAPAPAPPEQMTTDNSSTDLPRTASHTPMLFAIGLVAVLAASAVRLSGRGV